MFDAFETLSAMVYWTEVAAMDERGGWADESMETPGKPLPLLKMAIRQDLTDGLTRSQARSARCRSSVPRLERPKNSTLRRVFYCLCKASCTRKGIYKADMQPCSLI